MTYQCAIAFEAVALRRSLLRSGEPSAQSRLPDDFLVRVHAIEKDRYGRTVAEIFVRETFINAEMVRAGHAWHYRRYSWNCPNRGEIVQAANSTQLTGMPPWEFRKGN